MTGVASGRGDDGGAEARTLDQSGRALGPRALGTRQRLLDATARRREEKSVRDISVVDIARKANTSPAGPSEGITMRYPDRRNDHEAELSLIIGKQGSDIPKEKASDYIAGYSLGLDMTARGQEDRSFRKSIDGYTVLGPWMVTADEIPNPADVDFVLHVNDEKRQESNTKFLIFDIPRLIEFASQFYTLYPGDVYFTGTPEGVGPVKPGDWIKLNSLPQLGELRIQVRAHQK